MPSHTLSDDRLVNDLIRQQLRAEPVEAGCDRHDQIVKPVVTDAIQSWLLKWKTWLDDSRGPNLSKLVVTNSI